MTDNITTIESALMWARSALRDIDDNIMLDARLMLCEVLQVKQEYLIRYPEKALTIPQAAQFQRMVLDRAKGTPLAYLLGRQPFLDIEVFVTPGVLIPRPETELLVERAIDWARGRRHSVIVDVGAGSGIIALALARHLPKDHITGIDVSQEALDVAARNTHHLNLVNRVRWLQGDLLKPILERREQADLIVANLPYVATEEMKTLDVSRHEPGLALDGGADGLDVIRGFLADAPHVLRRGGLILMEIGATQGAQVRQLAQLHFPQASIFVDPDLAGLDRIVRIHNG